MPKLDLSFSANFLQQTSDLKPSGNLDLSLFSQISAGNLTFYAFWKIDHSFFLQISAGNLPFYMLSGKLLPIPRQNLDLIHFS